MFYSHFISFSCLSYFIIIQLKNILIFMIFYFKFILSELII
nr:MAG TPA: hypothetical protein [Caudoviricetes sp.]